MSYNRNGLGTSRPRGNMDRIEHMPRSTFDYPNLSISPSSSSLSEMSEKGDDSNPFRDPNSRPESYIDPQSTTRPSIALGRANGHRTLSDLYDESIPGTPQTQLRPEQPWLAGRPDSEATLSSSYPGTPTPLRSTDQLVSNLLPNASSFNLDYAWDKHIQRLHDRDDHVHLSGWKRYAYYTAPLLSVLTLAAYWLYFTLRILFVMSAQRKSRQSFPMAWVFIGTEIAVAIPIFMQSFWNIFILKKRNRPQLRLLGPEVPTVDVLVTCCKEDVDLIVDTVRAACELDYPRDRYRVIVLDDGNSQDLGQAITALAQTYDNLAYRSRTKIPGVPHHFKAGNLNYGLEEVKYMKGGASQFMAALDADMIPEPEWLRAILPHLLKDNKVALACPPQLFYNVPKGDPLAQSLDFFVHISEPVKDALGVAWCTGSGYVVRREALEDIGMFPQDSLAEDVATSTLMLGKGWKTAYVHEPLQFGTVPDSFGSHIKQRTRWAIGTVDTNIKLRFCLWGDKIKQMKFFPRLSGFLYAVLSLFNIPLSISLFALPIVLISGKPLIAYATSDQLRWLIRACFAALFINRLCEFVLYLPAGYATGQRGARAQLWMSPYISITIVRSFFLPKWLGGQMQTFQPSGSIKSELNERDASIRAPLLQRMRVTLFNYLGIYHVIYVYFCLSAISLTTSRCVAENGNLHDRLLCLLTHAFWPPISWLIAVSAFWTPVTYAIEPPSMPPREELLDVDLKTGVKRPKQERKNTAWGVRDGLFEIEYFVSTAFTGLVFAASFFF